MEGRPHRFTRSWTRGYASLRYRDACTIAHGCSQHRSSSRTWASTGGSARGTPSTLSSDGDIANNSGNWQWVAGAGNDTRPNRTFNPIRQALRFDPDGTYVRRRVPELASVPGSRVHTPWALDPANETGSSIAARSVRHWEDLHESHESRP
jgi:hypothetical protein